MFKFEKLEVWKLSVEYVDMIYEIAKKLPNIEEYNLKSQMIRAATSVALNIAEGSTSQTNTEFSRFISLSLRSCIEVIACLILVYQRKYIDEQNYIKAYSFGGKLFSKLQALRKSLKRQTTDHGQRTVT